jgi:hypothetical protein
MKTGDEQLCFCGQPLHYADPVNQAAVQTLVDLLGERVRVTSGGRSWLVPRHYIALHGLRQGELALLGFEEVSEL